MNPSKKSYTNSDIIAEVRGIKSMQIAQSKDIEMLKNWKIAEDAAKAAITEYRKDQELANRGRKEKTKYELYKQAAYVLGIIGMMLYAYLSLKGGK